MKAKILALVKEKVGERVKAAEKAMQAAQNSANEESKSSAGDKYETGRAMAQNDRDLYGRQHAEAKGDFQILELIHPENHFSVASLGSLVDTEMGMLFIAISVGIIDVDGKKVIVTSPDSPIGKSLNGKKAGENFEFRGKSVKIVTIS